MSRKTNLRRLSVLVTAQTLQKLGAFFHDGQSGWPPWTAAGTWAGWWTSSPGTRWCRCGGRGN